MNPQNTALILVDSENDFLSEQGKMYEAVKTVVTQNDLVHRLNLLLRECRAQGMTIIHTPMVVGEGCPEAGPNPYGIMVPVQQSGAFIKGTWGAKPCDLLDLHDTDLIIEKNNICAFLGTDLETTLKERGLKTIILAGLLTDVCVEATMRYGYDKGFEIYTVIDCTATLDPEKQRMTIEKSFPLFSKPVTHTEVLEMFTMQNRA